MKEMNFCQSCGMPIETEEMKGTNKDGGKCGDYCTYCYKDGEFTQNMTMDEMIELNLKFIDEWKTESGEELTIDKAREQLNLFMPTLKRWKQEKKEQ